jgi:lysophospholipase L1-like esterase
MRTLIILLCLALSLPGITLAGAEQQPLPKVVLLGDSIRLSYAPIVEKELADKAVVVSPKANGGDSSNNLKQLEEWVIREQPAIVHFNAGIHDTKKSKTTGTFQVPPDQYEQNLRKIVERIRKETNATVLFATTTPIIDERAAKGRAKADYELLNASVEQYNQIAKRVMQELKVPVDDLHAVVGDAEMRAKLISGDGVHFTAEGREALGKAVATFIKKHLPSEKN